jgi:hypothetical protein
MIQRDPLNLSEADLARLQESGEAVVVRVGDAEVVIQDASAYRALVAAIDDAEDARVAEMCQRRLDELESGKVTGMTGSEFIAAVRKQVGLDG